MHASTLARAVIAAAIAAAGCSSASGGAGAQDTSATADPLSATEPSLLAPPRARGISLNYKDTCAALTDGAVACWGRDTSGQLGDGAISASPHPRPQLVRGIASAVGVSAGTAQTCALLASGQAACWGDDFFGELGNGTRTNATQPTGVAGMRALSSLVTAEAFTCAVSNAGEVSCWGTDVFGQLGDDGETSLSSMPLSVPSVSDAIAVTAGLEHACALLSSGRVTCWGSNDSGQLGRATPAGQSAPVEAEGVTGAVAIAAGLVHTCALGGDGRILCWGYDGYGALGGGGRPDESLQHPSGPVRVEGISDAVGLAAGGYEACALRRCGEVSCWGRNDSGQLGDGTTTGAGVPVKVEGVANALEVAVGDGHACARLTNGEMVCWGENDLGQLGDGTTIERHVAVAVEGLP